jgi:hypothetical protein
MRHAPSKRLELIAVRVPHFGEHLGTCARVHARVRVRSLFFAQCQGDMQLKRAIKQASKQASKQARNTRLKRLKMQQH